MLAAVAVLGTGSLSGALTAQPGPITALRFAVSALLVVAALVLMTRVLIALVRPRPGPGTDGERP
ncbi:MAG: hypothetical protein BGO38_16095 [Cellulomonas sp. 73-145]|nr:MAG: hypothetical protein BGO38_16095 [Cellulomonas sp. 73-145]